MHKVTHLEDAPHKCPKCNKTFNQKANLKAHMQGHECEGDELLDVGGPRSAAPALDLSQKSYEVTGRKLADSKPEKSLGFSIDEILRK